MADFINAGSITNNSVTLSYEIDNSGRGTTVWGYIFLAPAGLTFTQIEANASTYLIQTRGVSAGNVLTDSITRTGLSPNTGYTFMYSVTSGSTFNASQVIYRRPLSPPGTFTTLGPPIFTDSTITSPGTVGTFYSDGVTASNATSYSLASGSLPPGVGLSTNNGAISGTPTVAGTYSFTVSANNQYGSTNAPLSLTINPQAPVWIDQTISSPAFKDAPYSDGVSASNGASYVISSGTLPTGLSLNTSTGAITGTPTVVETKNFTIQASNVTGTISVGLTLEVVDGLAPPVFTDSTLVNNLRVGIGYSDSVSASDATSYAFGGTPIPGLSVSSGGSVSGTPTAQGNYDFTIIASNAAGSATATFDLDVKPGGERWDGSAWQRIQTLKRWDGSAWVDVMSLKRWNGTSWTNANE